jgi:hypothetical protein
MPGWKSPQLWIVIVCLAVSALWIDLGDIHRCHTADSIVMALVSLYRWTPLYWEQDRLGMLFPLLATPWRHPLDNLLAQGAMTSLAALASMFLLGWYTIGWRQGTAVGALAGMFLVGFCRIDQQFEHFIMLQQNAQALAIGVAGLLLLDAWSRRGTPGYLAAGVGAIGAAHWINPGLAFVLGPLVVVRGVCFRELPDYLQRCDGVPSLPTEPSVAAGRWFRLRLSNDELLAIGAILVSLAGCVLMSRLAASPKPYGFLAPADCLSCVSEMYHGLHVYLHHRWFSATEIVAGLGLATLLVPSGRRMLGRSLPLVAGLLLVAGVQFVFMGSLDHVRENHSARYVLPAVFLWQAALIGFGAVQIGAVLPERGWTRSLPASLVVAMTLVVMLRHGWPSVDRVRVALDESIGRYSDDLLAGNCTHVTGDYWHVWPAMFHANLRLADANSPRVVWGIANRSRPTEAQWRNVSWTAVRVGEIAGDEVQAAQFLTRYRFPPLTEHNRVGDIRVLEPVEVAKLLPAPGSPATRH